MEADKALERIGHDAGEYREQGPPVPYVDATGRDLACRTPTADRPEPGSVSAHAGHDRRR
jgi:hypothetical protein